MLCAIYLAGHWVAVIIYKIPTMVIVGIVIMVIICPIVRNFIGVNPNIWGQIAMGIIYTGINHGYDNVSTARSY